MIKAVMNLEAPRHHVFQILTDYPKYKAWLPGCEESTVVSSSGTTSETQFVINGMKRMTVGLKFEAVPTQVLNFAMTSCKELKAYSGSYRLMDSADGKGTVVVAEMELDPGAMVPKFMLDRMAKKSIEDTSAALQKYVRSVPVEGAPPAAAPKPAAPAASRRRPARRVMKVVKTPAGYKVWMMGETLEAVRK